MGRFLLFAGAGAAAWAGYLYVTRGAGADGRRIGFQDAIAFAFRDYGLGVVGSVVGVAALGAVLTKG